MNLKIPIITTLHDVHALISNFPLLYRFKYFFRYASPKIMTRAKKIFLTVPTKYVKTQVVEYLRIPAEKIEVIPAAVNAPSWVFNISKKRARNMVKEVLGVEDYVLFIARQLEVPMVVSAIELLRTVYHLSIPLVIAGRGIDKATSEKLADMLGLKESILVLGAISEHFKWILLRGAKVFISLETSTSGFGIPQIEAICVGTPVVASATGPTKEVIGEGGLLTKYDAGEIANAIYECYNSRTACSELSHRGYERAKIFQPEKVASRLLKYIEKVKSYSG